MVCMWFVCGNFDVSPYCNLFCMQEYLMLFSACVPVTCVYFGAQSIGIVISCIFSMLVVVEVLLIILQISVALL